MLKLNTACQRHDIRIEILLAVQSKFKLSLSEELELQCYSKHHKNKQNEFLFASYMEFIKRHTLKQNVDVVSFTSWKVILSMHYTLIALLCCDTILELRTMSQT